MGMENLDEWDAYILRGTSMEHLGTVYGDSELDAMEAAENIARMSGNGFSAVKVEMK